MPGRASGKRVVINSFERRVGPGQPGLSRFRGTCGSASHGTFQQACIFSMKEQNRGLPVSEATLEVRHEVPTAPPFSLTFVKDFTRPMFEEEMCTKLNMVPFCECQRVVCTTRRHQHLSCWMQSSRKPTVQSSQNPAKTSKRKY